MGSHSNSCGLHTNGVTLIDSVVFGQQAIDISYGRSLDAGNDWRFCGTPTPEQSNGNTGALNLVKIAYPKVDTAVEDGGVIVIERKKPVIGFTYNPYGQVETMISPDDIVTKYEYYDDGDDSYNFGRLKKVIRDYGLDDECLNVTTRYEYDALGNIAEIKDSDDNITGFTYDDLSLLREIEAPSPFNYLTKLSYNENKKLSKVAAQLGATFNSATAQTTEYTYNILDKLEMIIDPLGKTATFDHDNNQNLSSVVDAEGRKLGNDYETKCDYDERDLLWKITDAEGAVTEYSYDDNGNLRKIRDDKGQETIYNYDDFDRVETITYPDTTTEVFGYDAASNK